MRLLIGSLALFASVSIQAGPEEDRLAFREFFEKRFPAIELDAHIDGAYALDAEKREQWLSMEDFPPYEIAVDDGNDLFETPFQNGTSYADCFENDGAVKHLYPQYDPQRDTVVTLEMAINDCRLKNGEQSLPYTGQEMVQLTAYMAYISRDNLFNIEVSPEALAAYEDGKQYYYSRRGQLNFACSHCHMSLTGMKLRAETLSASLGQVTHWPAYRLKWQETGPLHRRYARCNQQVGAEALPFQSETYRNLEYFMTYMANELPVNGPATRK